MTYDYRTLEKTRLLHSLRLILLQRKWTLERHHSDEIGSWWLKEDGHWDGQRHLFIQDPRNPQVTRCGIPVALLRSTHVKKLYRDSKDMHTRMRWVPKPPYLPQDQCLTCYRHDTCEIPL